jgi:hypothetical protein
VRPVPASVLRTETPDTYFGHQDRSVLAVVGDDPATLALSIPVQEYLVEHLHHEVEGRFVRLVDDRVRYDQRLGLCIDPSLESLRPPRSRLPVPTWTWAEYDSACAGEVTP